MANAKDLRRRIKSVKNTSSVTRAMQMVSATKMRKAQSQAVSSRPYADLLSKVLMLISKGELEHPLLQAGEGKTALVIFSTDKGLCGALNTNLFREVSRVMGQGSGNDIFYTVGKKGRDFVVRTGKDLKGDFENHERAEFSDAAKVGRFLINEFKDKKFERAYLLYSGFVSTLVQEPKTVQVLPIEAEALKHHIAVVLGSENGTEEDVSGEFLFEPDINGLLDYALTHFIEIQIFKAFLETRASEHSARMIAMQNATNNASELVEDLTLTYNQLRQESITRELLESASAGAALE